MATFNPREKSNKSCSIVVHVLWIGNWRTLCARIYALGRRCTSTHRVAALFCV